jgi:hypothetical protein
MTTTYFGILLGGTTIEKHTLDEVNSVPEVEYILKSVKSIEWANPSTYTIINPDGSRCAFRIGGYEVLDIGEESPGTQGGTKTITIKELRTEIIFKIWTNNAGVGFFMHELIPQLKELNEVGSWRVYQKLIELDKASKEIEQLKSKIISLEASLSDR